MGPLAVSMVRITVKAEIISYGTESPEHCLVYGNFCVNNLLRVGGDLAYTGISDISTVLLLRIIIWVITMMMITNRRYYLKISGYLTLVIFGDPIAAPAISHPP